MLLLIVEQVVPNIDGWNLVNEEHDLRSVSLFHYKHKL